MAASDRTPDVPDSTWNRRFYMQRLIGFILFWIGIGMCIMLFLHHGLLALCIIIACLVLGYNLFSCK